MLSARLILGNKLDVSNFIYTTKKTTKTPNKIKLAEKRNLTKISQEIQTQKIPF